MASRSKDDSQKDDVKKTSTRESSTAKKSVKKTKASASKEKAASESKSSTSKKTSKSKSQSKTSSKTPSKKTAGGIKGLYEALVARYPETEHLALKSNESILEHLAFAIFLEVGTVKQAKTAFLEIRNNFVDWNEVRVARANEIASVVGDRPESHVAGERLRGFLQCLFDKTYDFNLEELRQQGVQETVDFISSIPYATRFAIDCVKRFAFGGTELPLNEGSLRALRLLGMVNVVDDQECLDFKSAKFTAVEELKLFVLLHALGLELMDSESETEALEFLKTFDPKVETRSDEPLVESSLTDPLEITRLLIKKHMEETYGKPTDNKRKAAVSSAQQAKKKEEVEDDSDDDDGDEDNDDDSQGVVETKLVNGETRYFDESSAKARDKRAQKDSSFFRSSSDESKLFVSVPFPPESEKKSDGKTKKSAGTKASQKTEKKAAKDKGEKAPTASKTARSSATKKSSKTTAAQSASKRASQNLPEKPSGTKRRPSARAAAKGGASADKSADSKSSKSDVGKGDNAPKKSAKSKDDAAKDASKLKEIQQKKPR